MAASVADDPAIELRHVETVADRELVRTLRGLEAPPAALVVPKVNATLIRTLRDRPPTLVVVTGDIDAQDLSELRDLAPFVLGPRASLHVGEGNTLLCAANRHELIGLERAIGRVLGSHDADDPRRATLRIGLAPTPPWFDELARSEAMRGCAVIGYVPRPALHLGWARWLANGHDETADEVEATLVPLGVEQPPLEPREAGLEAAVAAHTLERLTGPVFPAPRVLALLHRGQHRDDLEGAVGRRDPDALAVWAQARRALPLTGAALGMEEPDADVPVDVPTAAFLAQRALLRVRRRRALLAEAHERPPLPVPDPELLDRAAQVLTASGEVLSEHESKVVLRGFDIEITRQAVASSASGAAQYGETIGFPVVLKVLSPDLRRKSEVGAVHLDLHNAAAVRRAYSAIMTAVQDRAPTARIDGILVAEQVGPGLEINCGGLRTRSGDVVVYGRVVGTSAPVEPALALAPTTPEAAVLMAHAVLSRVPVPALRRASDPDVHLLADLFLRIAAVFEHTEDRILAADLGPVRLVGGDRGYVTLDARIQQRPHLEGV